MADETTTPNETTQTPVTPQSPMKETQEMTEKVLNIKYALDKLELEKSKTQSELTQQQDALATVTAQNETQQANNIKLMEEADGLMKTIQERKEILDAQESKNAEEISEKQKELKKREDKVSKAEKEVEEKKDEILKRQIGYQDKEAEQNSIARKQELRTLELDEKEASLKTKNDTLDTFKDALDKKQEEQNNKQDMFEKWEKSLKLREEDATARLANAQTKEESIAIREAGIGREYENIALEKEKTKKYITILNELQERFIKEIMKTGTVDANEVMTMFMKNLDDREAQKHLPSTGEGTEIPSVDTSDTETPEQDQVGITKDPEEEQHQDVINTSSIDDENKVVEGEPTIKEEVNEVKTPNTSKPKK